jgi:hypothetical protein
MAPQITRLLASENDLLVGRVHRALCFGKRARNGDHRRYIEAWL